MMGLPLDDNVTYLNFTLTFDSSVIQNLVMLNALFIPKGRTLSCCQDNAMTSAYPKWYYMPM